MNDDLKTALMTAEASLSAEFGFELDHGRREVVWAALGPRLSATGRQRRGRLAITVARHVLPLWSVCGRAIACRSSCLRLRTMSSLVQAAICPKNSKMSTICFGT